MRKMVKAAAAGMILALTLGLTACAGSSDKGAESSSADSASESKQDVGSTSGNDAESTAGNTEEASDNTDGASDGTLDLSKYPADINEWTVQNFVDYFTAAGVFTNKDWTWIQDHANYWVDTPVNEGCGYMDEEGQIMICIYTFDPDSTEADVPAFLDYIRENKKFTDEYMSMPMDHMAGNVVFSYIFTSDEAVYNAMDQAYNELIKALNVTPDF